MADVGVRTIYAVRGCFGVNKVVLDIGGQREHNVEEIYTHARVRAAHVLSEQNPITQFVL